MLKTGAYIFDFFLFLFLVFSFIGSFQELAILLKIKLLMVLPIDRIHINTIFKHFPQWTHIP